MLSCTEIKIQHMFSKHLIQYRKFTSNWLQPRGSVKANMFDDDILTSIGNFRRHTPLILPRTTNASGVLYLHIGVLSPQGTAIAALHNRFQYTYLEVSKKINFLIKRVRRFARQTKRYFLFKFFPPGGETVNYSNEFIKRDFSLAKFCLPWVDFCDSRLSCRVQIH